MQKMLMSVLVGGSAVLSVYAAEESELAAVCDRLEKALEQQVDALSSIKDAASAAAALPAIERSLADQKALFGIDERELWNYIDHTEMVKVSLMRILQRLGAQADRLKKADFFGNKQLESLLF